MSFFAGAGSGTVSVLDSETEDCDGLFGGMDNSDKLPDADFDGDLDVGTGGGVFGHGTWAEHCGFHLETRGSISLDRNTPFLLGSDDALGFLFDPETGENTCITDGIISPNTDLEDDDCLSQPGTGTQPITCPGGGDGLLWVLLLTAPFASETSESFFWMMGTITSP